VACGSSRRATIFITIQRLSNSRDVMGRIRTIKPEFTQDEDLSKLPAETHLLAAGILTYSDDEGYFQANPNLVMAAVFPLRECSVSIHDMLKQLAEIGYIQLGTTASGKRVGRVTKFSEHQRVNRPTASKIRCLTIDWDNSVTTHGELIEVSLPEGKGREGKGREGPVIVEFDAAKAEFTPIPEFSATDATSLLLIRMKLSGEKMRTLARDAIKTAMGELAFDGLAAGDFIANQWDEYKNSTLNFKVGKQKFLETGVFLEKLTPTTTAVPPTVKWKPVEKPQ
jgi:hypothetical protein